MSSADVEFQRANLSIDILSYIDRLAIQRQSDLRLRRTMPIQDRVEVVPGNQWSEAALLTGLVQKRFGPVLGIELLPRQRCDHVSKRD